MEFMMKQILVFPAMLLISVSVTAAPVDVENAWLKAAEYAKIHMAGKTLGAIKRTPLRTDWQNSGTETVQPYYIFTIESGNGGFVIVSGDDRTEPILGFSDEGGLNPENLPENMKAFLDEYACAIRHLDSIKKQSPVVQFPVNKYQSFDPIEPLLTTNWDQISPYNHFCPIIDNQHCLTGCLATAMAQIMNYYKWPAVTSRTIPAYTTPGLELYVDSVPVTTIDWDNIQDNYSKFTKSRSDTAVANLMMLCGRSVSMEYALDGSGAYNYVAMNAFPKYFSYNERTLSLIARRLYKYSDWQRIIYAELSEKRPVLYGGSGTHGGHAFICDGYKGEEDFFHINWGWSGHGNGYFRLNLANPYSKDAEGFGDGQAAFIGIIPDYDHENKQTMWNEYFAVKDISVLENNYTYIRTGNSDHFPPFSVVYNTQNISDKPYCSILGFKLLDADCQTVQTFYDPLTENVSLDYGWYTLPEEACQIAISSNLPDGIYRLVATSHTTDTDEMIPDILSDHIFIELSIREDTLNILTRNPAYNLILNNYTVDGGLLTDSTQTITLFFECNGYDYHDEIRVDDEYDHWIPGFVELEAGESTAIMFNCTTSVPGPHTFTVHSSLNFTPIGTFTLSFSNEDPYDPSAVGGTLIGNDGNTKQDGVVYDLKGNLMGTPSQLPSLPQGIYISGGTKIVR